MTATGIFVSSLSGMSSAATANLRIFFINYYRLAFFYELVKFTRWIKSAKFPENYVSCGYVDLWNDLDKNNYLSQTSSSFYVEKCSRRVLEWHITYQYNHKEIYIQRLELTGDLKKLCFLNQI